MGYRYLEVRAEVSTGKRLLGNVDKGMTFITSEQEDLNHRRMRKEERQRERGNKSSPSPCHWAPVPTTSLTVSWGKRVTERPDDISSF